MPRMPIYLIWIFWALSTIVGLFVGGFLKSYMSKKGENLATHEDIEKLVDQVRAVTQTTKEIEAKISGDMWDRQKRWEMRRDLFLTVASNTASLLEALTEVHAVYMTEKNNEQAGIAPRLEKRAEVAEKWGKACQEFDESFHVLGIVCEKATRTTVGQFSLRARETWGKMVKGHPEAFQDDVKELVADLDRIRLATRKELGVDP